MTIEQFLLMMLVEDQHKVGNDSLDTQSLLLNKASEHDVAISDDLLDYVDMLHLNLEQNNGAYNYTAKPFVS